MSLVISPACQACNRCTVACPTGAIRANTSRLSIEPELCTECVGDDDLPRCQQVCMHGAIVPHPHHRESLFILAERYLALRRISASADASPARR